MRSALIRCSPESWSRHRRSFSSALVGVGLHPYLNADLAHVHEMKLKLICRNNP